MRSLNERFEAALEGSAVWNTAECTVVCHDGWHSYRTSDGTAVRVTLARGFMWRGKNETACVSEMFDADFAHSMMDEELRALVRNTMANALQALQASVKGALA